jgi:transcription termination factor Rho
MTIAELKEKNITELSRIARTLEIPGASGLRKQDLIFKILQAQSEKEGHIFADGVLEILPDGYGFLRSPDYLVGSADSGILISSASSVIATPNIPSLKASNRPVSLSIYLSCN